MKSIINPLILFRAAKSTQGFSLIETMVALTTLGVCLAYAMPLFLYAKINNSKSEIRTGALIVSQRIFDNIRSRPFNPPITTPPTLPRKFIDIPNTDGEVRDLPRGNPDGSNPEFKPENMAAITTDEKLVTYAMGRQYQAKVTYCAGKSLDPKICTQDSRKFKVEVSYNGSKVYDLEGTYTNFQ